MRQTFVARSTAIQVLLLLAAALCILSVYPARIWRTKVTSSAGDLESNLSAPVTREETLQVSFTAQYDFLRSIRVEVVERIAGRSIELNFLDENMQLMHKRYYDLDAYGSAGEMELPVNIALTPGETYRLIIKGLFSTQTFVYVKEDESGSPYIHETYYHDTRLEGEKLKLTLTYTPPLSKGRSLLLIGLTAAVAACLCLVVRRYYQKPLPWQTPPKEIQGQLRIDPPVTIGRIMQRVGNPVVCIFFGLLLVAVILHRFDDRMPDVLFYSLGILAAWGYALYVLNRGAVSDRGSGTLSDDSVVGAVETARSDSVPDPLSEPGKHLAHLLQLLCIDAMLWYSTDYMNGTADIFHDISVRKLTIAFLLLMLFTFSLTEIPRIPSLACLAVSAAAAVYYVSNHLLGAEETEYDLHNTVTILSAVCAVLAIQVLLWTGMALWRERAEREAARPAIYLILTTGFALLFLLFRNGRMWIAALIFFYGLFFLRFSAWRERDTWMERLMHGLLFHFAHTVLYCLCFRFYAGFKTSRFAMRFHTVTVTAEYLSVMMAAVFVLFLWRMKRVYNTKGGLFLAPWWRNCYKEAAAFGTVAAYTILTLSRTAYVSTVVTGMVLLVVNVRDEGKEALKCLAKRLGLCIAAALLAFPAVFTLQRTLPVVVGHPEIFEVEGMDERLTAGVNWDHRNLMSVERFAGLFANKILGQPEPGYDYPEDRYNYTTDNQRIYDTYGYPLSEESSGPRRARTARTEWEAEAADSFTNGRLTIFGTYMEQLNLTGHETMGATLPDGTELVHAHNSYLQMMYDCGALTGIVFCFWLLAGLFAAYRYGGRVQKEGGRYGFLPFSLIVSFMVVGVTEWNFHYANPMTIALLLGMAPLLSEQETDSNG